MSAHLLTFHQQIAGDVPMRAVLSSWKEIASYLGKGVRTVQRWERELDLPVRRPKPNEKQIVLAFPDELDAWVRRQSNNRQPSDIAYQRKELIRLRELIERTMTETKRLQSATEELMKRHSNRNNSFSENITDIHDRKAG